MAWGRSLLYVIASGGPGRDERVGWIACSEV